jgi:aminopeptidase N
VYGRNNARAAPTMLSSSVTRRGLGLLTGILGLSAASGFSSSALTAHAHGSMGGYMAGTAVAEDGSVKETFRLDFKPSTYKIPELDMKFELGASKTLVTTTQVIVPESSNAGDLVLDGEDCITLKSMKIDGNVISPENYKIEGDNLIISASVLPTKQFKLETVVEIAPDKNLQLAGLYASGSNLLCTQCEAMGFRRITYHLDRPDILSKYRVRLEADKKLYPQLLSNGNFVSSGDLGENKHYAEWYDPFPKPSYLFAVVAADLGSIHDTFTTASGREVKLGIYCEKDDVNKLSHAMYSIKEAMKWDEQTFGLECDLDIYNIVATSDFNMGAMENKGLNIFNSAYVLANSDTATDADYANILGVIGHEYFHNWTGNRVTVRDWFQLTLKEGLTVHRDQWFSSDMSGAADKRIADVRGLRGRQFAEDAGPMAHPIRPESYISMDNFYTATVYSKGAEVIRMYRTILGDEGFKKGMKLYFERHDGDAVTCDDFRAAMSDANNYDLTQFERWYKQAGTPVVNIDTSYDASSKQFKMKLTQRTPTTPGPNQKEEEKLPLHMPVVVGLLDKVTGKEVMGSTVVQFTEAQQEFVFPNIEADVIPSIFRGFSAPVKINMEQSNEELAFLMAYDTDSFNKWDASYRLASKVILGLVSNSKSIEDIESAGNIPDVYINAIRTVLSSCSNNGDSSEADSLAAFTVMLPDLSALSQNMDIIDVEKLVAARKKVKKSLGMALKSEFETVYTSTNPTGPYIFSSKEGGRRRLHNIALDYLSSSGDAEAATRAKAQFDNANCMTDNISALGSLVSNNCQERSDAIETFHKNAKGDALVLNKWFAIQAMADTPDQIERVKALKTHKDFLLSNPNRCRSLIGTFSANMPHFHAASGEGYKFVAETIIELDKLNPQVAARMCNGFSQWKRFDDKRQALMKAELEKIKGTDKLSKDTFEVVSKYLK